MMLTKEAYRKLIMDKLDSCMIKHIQLKKDLDECDSDITQLFKMLEDPREYELYCRLYIKNQEDLE